VLGGSVGIEPARPAAPVSLPMPMGEPVSGPRKWLRSATSIFSSRSGHSVMAPLPPPPPKAEGRDGRETQGRDARDRSPQRAKKFDAPVPLSEFAKRGKSSNSHSGHGRRDALSAGERTRILRMLRDEGGRLADEDSQVYIGAAPGAGDYDFDFDDAPPVGPPAAQAPPLVRADIPAKPAVVVGLAAAQAARTAGKRTSERVAAAPRVTAQQAAPPPPPSQPPPIPYAAQLPPPPGPRSRQIQAVPAGPSTIAGVSPNVLAGANAAAARKPLPAPFSDEPTRQVDDELLAALRNAPPAKPSPPVGRTTKPSLPKPSTIRAAAPDEPTRMAAIDSLDSINSLPIDEAHAIDGGSSGYLDDEMTRPAEDLGARFLAAAPNTDPGFGSFEDHRDPEEATRLASLDGIAAMERARNHGPTHEDRTRAVNIRNDPSISDIDWDLD
jgi:hypothetical protein